MRAKQSLLGSNPFSFEVSGQVCITTKRFRVFYSGKYLRGLTQIPDFTGEESDAQSKLVLFASYSDIRLYSSPLVQLEMADLKTTNKGEGEAS